MKIFTFFYIHKKKVLDVRKFSTSGFRWIYMFRDVLNTIWSLPENVCLSAYVCIQKFLGTVSQELMRKLMKLYIQLHPDIIQCWSEFGSYCSWSSDVVRNFSSFNTVVKDKIVCIVPNTNCFKPVILKFKIYIYNSNSKIIYKLFVCIGTIGRGEVSAPPGRNFLPLVFFFFYKKKKNLKLRKTHGWIIYMW